MKTIKKFCRMALVLALACSLATTLSQLALPLNAQDIYVDSLSGAIGVYSASGAAVHLRLITAGIFFPGSIVFSGNNLFVVSGNSGNSIGEYTLSGQTVNASLITNLDQAAGIAVSGTNLFVANSGNGTIGEYSTSGLTINASLITGLSSPLGIAISGEDLFVASQGGNSIGEYTTSGATINTSLITGLNQTYGIAISGTNLFVAVSGAVGLYSTSGLTINASLISDSALNFFIAIFGTNLFVANWDSGTNTGTIGEYTTSGATINASLISGLYHPVGIAILPPPQFNIAPAGNQSVLFYPYPVPVTGFILQSTTNLASTSWVTVSNGVPVIGMIVTNSSPASFFRLAPTP